MAIITCQEIIDLLDDWEKSESGKIINCYGQDYWREVIKEIEQTNVIFNI